MATHGEVTGGRRTLVLGVGAVGGYYGARLLAAGRDVTFLVRPGRQATVRARGLHVRSPLGDLDLDDPPTVAVGSVGEPYDLILLACKAFDLEAAMESIAPAVGDGTLILPLLNGIRHVEVLAGRFGSERVLGGACRMSATLDPQGTIVHLNGGDPMVFGELSGRLTPRARGVEQELAGAGFELRLTDAIVQEMWEKWMFIAACSAITCLLRGSLGEIQAAGGADLSLRAYEEAVGIAAHQGYAPRAAAQARTRMLFTDPDSTFTSSMIRDVEAGRVIELDHLLGDLLARAPEPAADLLLRSAYVQLRAYQARRWPDGVGSGAPRP